MDIKVKDKTATMIREMKLNFVLDISVSSLFLLLVPVLYAGNKGMSIANF